MKTKLIQLVLVVVGLGACTAEETKIEDTDFKFDGTCVNCHAGLTAGHAHANYKLRCVDCHGGNDQVAVPENVLQNKSVQPGAGGFRDPNLLKQAHVLPDPNIARYFYANGVDDDGDGLVDEPPILNANGTLLEDQGEIFEPGLHGEGPGEFMDAELNRDLNYTRFYNPGDLRIATISCGSKSRGAFDGGGNGLCHQQTIDIVRRSMMVNQAAVTNGAYYGNESWRPDVAKRMANVLDDPRFGAFGYQLDYTEVPAGGTPGVDLTFVDQCIQDPPDGNNPRSQPFFDKDCLQKRALDIDNSFDVVQGGKSIFAGASGNTGVGTETPSPFEIAQGNNVPVIPFGTKETAAQGDAGDTRFAWGGQAQNLADGHEVLTPLLTDFLIPPGGLPQDRAIEGIPDPVDNILRTFRAYYPLNYPASTTNFNFTFGTSILPEVKRFRTASPYGRGHSSGCSACHAPYNYEGNRAAQKIRKENPTDTNGDGKLDDEELFDLVDDPTTKHREFNPDHDIGQINGVDRLIGRPVSAKDVADAGPVSRAPVDIDGDGVPDGEQQRAYSANHTLTTKIDTDTCGLCHGFVTRINYVYQGMAEEEQRDAGARRAPIEFTTPNGTNVEILDSWVREDNDVDNNGVPDAQPTLIIPDGTEIVELAKQRDAELAKQGFSPGFGGCVLNVFTEDCNNNGELDRELVLKKFDVDGNVIATTTINEDLNGDGKLSLIDKLPREKAIDGRQVRYVYGGRNGSTRQMDVHFQVGMHCIDCHFIQDVHGDGNTYSTNWDAIEIECEDCHGTSFARTTFLTSGPNGGNDLRKALNEDLEPFFEDRGGKVIQRSRVTNGLSWIVPQTIDIDAKNPYAKEAHTPALRPDAHQAAPGAGSEFAGEQGSSELTVAKLECQTCHNGWITNCLGCHVEINVGDKQRNKVLPGPLPATIVKSAGENEIWLSNQHNPGHINFQLLGLLRAPFVLGVASRADVGRLVNVRSSMQVMAGASDALGDTIRENLSFTTFQPIDGNSGRMNVATSGVVMNQTMPHSVRPAEARGCELCHALLDNQGRVRNEHIISETMGIGTGSLPFTGDWIIAAGGAQGVATSSGMELFEYKQERELGNNLVAGASTRFPGLIVNPNDRVSAAVEPNFDGAAIPVGSIGVDVALIRNFNSTPALGGVQPPTLRDLAILAVDTNNGAGRLVATDISLRGHPLAARPSSGAAGAVATVNLPGTPRALAHIASDVSDPFVYVAVSGAGIAVVRIDDAPGVGVPMVLANTTALQGGRAAADVALAGDFLYVGTNEGTVDVFNINNPESPQPIGSTTVDAGQAIQDIAISGFTMYVTTTSGLFVLALDDPGAPAAPRGANQIPLVPITNAHGIYANEGHVFVAAGADGIHEIDARTTAAPVDLGDIVTRINGSNQINGQAVNAVDVIVSEMPGQRWVIGLEVNGNIVGIKLDNTVTKYERCYPDPGAADCLMEMEMFDPTRSGRDPSFDPVTGQFDIAVDPSAVQTFRQNRLVLGNGRHLARPVTYETIGTLSGRRYRDSFMPGAGVMSLQVMQRMRGVEVCEVQEQGSTNPSGLGELGYFIGGTCQPFTSAAARKAKPVCNPKSYGPGIRGLLCEHPNRDVRVADPTANPGAPAPTQPAPPVADPASSPQASTSGLMPATAAVLGVGVAR